MEPLLNKALVADKNRILAVSVFITAGVEFGKQKFGEHGRVYSEKAQIDKMIKAECELKQNGKMLVMGMSYVQSLDDPRLILTVSGTDDVRDQVRAAVRSCADANTRLWDHEYQPETPRY